MRRVTLRFFQEIFDGGARSAANRATVDRPRHCFLQVDLRQSCDKCNKGEALLNRQTNQEVASIKNVDYTFQPSLDFEHK